MVKQTALPRRQGTQRERNLANLVKRQLAGEHLHPDELKKKGVSAAAVSRAKKSIISGKPVGHCGRHGYLTAIEETELVAWIASRPPENPPRAKDVAQKVFQFLVPCTHAHIHAFKHHPNTRRPGFT